MASSITGYMKIFYKNFLIDYSNSVAVSSGSTTASSLYDLDRSTRWISSGSNDSTQETIEITFDSAQTIDRIVIQNCNWKNFQIQYDAGIGYTDFTNVFSFENDNPASSINVTGNTYDARYFEFDSVSINSIKFFIDTTQTVDAEKYVYEIYVGKEMGTFIDDPTSKPNKFQFNVSNKNAKYLMKSNGGMIKIEHSDKVSAKLTLKEVWEINDITLIQTMFDQGEFVVYPCGASTNYTLERGWRLKDLYHVLIKGDEESTFSIGRDKSLGQNFKFELLEL